MNPTPFLPPKKNKATLTIRHLHTHNPRGGQPRTRRLNSPLGRTNDHKRRIPHKRDLKHHPPQARELFPRQSRVERDPRLLVR